MREKPILFSAPMVRAILDGRKTQTRRIIKPQPSKPFGGIFCDGVKWWTGDSLTGEVIETIRVPYAVGDRLWVREAWAEACELDDNDKPSSEMRTYYRADGEPFSRWLDPDTDEWRDGVKWRPSIYMPRWASRITLEVTAVRVQRLQEISPEDAEAEGVFRYVAEYSINKIFRDKRGEAAIGYFSGRWETLHGDGSWDLNPWVVALTFRRVPQ